MADRAITITAGTVSAPARLNDSRTARAIWEALFCIFFGPTPASHGDEIRPASPVNVVGQVVGDAREFKRVRSGARVVLERA